MPTPIPCNHNENEIRQRHNYTINDGQHKYEAEIGVCKGCLNFVARPAGERDWRVLLIARPRVPADAPKGQKDGDAKKDAKIKKETEPANPKAESAKVEQ